MVKILQISLQITITFPKNVKNPKTSGETSKRVTK